RREWLFLICLLLMVEYWIFQSARDFSNSQEVLNYVSFAGTIASIILAVVAIIYSFVQNDSQQTISGILSRELENLKDVASDLSGSNVDLKNHLNRVDQITDKLEVLDKGMLQSQGQLTTIHGEVAKLTALQSGALSIKSSPSTGNSGNDSLSKKILRQSTFDADVAAYALYKYNLVSEESQPDYYDFLADFYAKNSLKAASYRSGGVDIALREVIGTGNQIFMVLRSLNLLRLDKSSDGKPDRLILSEELIAALPEIIEEIRSSENAFVKAALVAIDEYADKINNG
ncbi:hypothetical protein, partial [Janthinobacterium sp. Ant5-2-1]|uniref:hypothetical protein n=1 Tax=Janthinobacterium sp. Ant5-2-1 TaxID=1755239 RepID=UPI000AA794FE